jgi:uncharacterized protein (TIGR02688 family)
MIRRRPADAYALSGRLPEGVSLMEEALADPESTGWEIPKMRSEFFTDHYGFVVDYLAEALRELRKHNFAEVLDRHFSLGSHLHARDAKAVRKSVSGYVKLLYPHGEFSREELAEILELAIEGRRRVKEQLKKCVRVPSDLILVSRR